MSLFGLTVKEVSPNLKDAYYSSIKVKIDSRDFLSAYGELNNFISVLNEYCSEFKKNGFYGVCLSIGGVLLEVLEKDEMPAEETLINFEKTLDKLLD